MVKTRLVPRLGAEGAAALHARLTKLALAAASRAAPDALELHADPAEDDFLRYCAARYGARLVPQVEGDLGARMRFAFQRALEQTSAAIVIGSDCPALTPRHLRLAAAALAQGRDAVFVPAEDGGYALVGLRRCHAGLFDRIPWGSAAVMAKTRERVGELGLRAVELETLWDVDRPEDYERLLSSGLLEAARAGARVNSPAGTGS